MKTEIYIATHKAYDFPSIEGYIPIHVGKALTDLDLGIIGDNTGDNISDLNLNFCELTALYWMWKNSTADILGLVHYRRYFFDNEGVLSNFVLKNNEIILAKKEKSIKKVFIKFLNKNILKSYMSTCEQYSYYHSSKDWNTLRLTIAEIYPEYLSTFDDVSNSNQGISHYNMFIANQEFVNGYCEWLFNILFQLKFKLNDEVEKYDNYQKRIYGFMSERLLNVYVRKNKFKIKYLCVK